MKKFRENWKIGIALIIVMLIVAMPVSEVYGQEEILSPEEKREQEMEEIGEDIVINVEEYQPKIVRASLLEEQGVNVHALLTGIPSNPTISIPNIQSVSVRPTKITTKPENLKDKVKIGNIRYYAPGRKELFSGFGLEMQGYRQDASFNNLGYLRIPIKAIPKEDDVPEEITIEMDGFVYYYVSEGLGFTQTEMVLNEMSESEWMKQREQNSFFGGYLRADKIGKDSAEFILYDNSGVAVDRKISVSRGGSSGRLDSYGFFRRLFGNDYSSKKNLFSKFKIRVDEIRGKGPTAEVMIFKDNDFLHRVLKEGDSLYAGSDWYVDRIRERVGSEREDGPEYKEYIIKEVTLRSNLGLEEKLKLILKQVTREKTTGIAPKQGEAVANNFECGIKLDLSKEDFASEISNLLICIDDEKTKKDAISKLIQIRIRYNSLIAMLNLEKGNLEMKEKVESDVNEKTKLSNQIKGLDSKIGGYEQDIEIINDILPAEEVGSEIAVEVKGLSKSEDAYENAIVSFNKVITNYAEVRDGDRLLAAEAQKEIVNIYLELMFKDPTTYQGLAINAIEELLSKYPEYVPGGDNLRKLANDLKRVSFSYNTEKANKNLDGFDVSLINVNVAREGSIVTLEGADGRLYEKTIGDGLDELGLEGEIVREIYDDSILITSTDFEAGFIGKVGEIFLSGTRKVLGLGKSEIVSYTYKYKENDKEKEKKIEVRVTVKDIDLKREVKVTLIPEIERAYSRAHFNLHIPIEKRPFKLPLFSDSIDEEINKTQKLINKTQKLIDKLEKLHNYWSKFCLVTFASLTVKNFFFGAKNAAARKEIREIWRGKYDKSKEKGEGWSYDRYVINKRSEYAKDLKDANEMVREGEKIKDINDRTYYIAKKRAQLWGKENPSYIDTYVNAEINKIESVVDNEIKDIKEEELKKKLVDISDRYNLHLSFDQLKQEYREKRLQQEYNKFFNERKIGIKKEGNLDLNDWRAFLDKEDIDVTKFSDEQLSRLGLANIQSKLIKVKGFGEQVSIYDINTDDGTNYKLYSEKYNGEQIYFEASTNGYSPLTDATYVARINGPLYINVNGKFEQIQFSGITQERLKMDPKLALASSGRQQGLVGMISISAYLYAEVEYTSGGAIKSIDIYKRANPNDPLGEGIRQFTSVQDAENWLTAKIKQEPGNEELINELKGVQEIGARIINCNREITQSGFGFRRKAGDWVACGENRFLIDNAKAPITASCTDVMDPIDCGIMFNACDPVMCPASRCNLRGNWQLGPGESVAETGIIGSVALCLGNAGAPPEGVIMPVCLTGILAGLKNIQSMLVGYRECLKVSKTEGKSVGICDKVRNVAICDILWREALAIFGVKGGLLNFVFSKLGGDKGGGEYIGSMQERVDSSKAAMEYFTQDYAKNVFAKYSGGSLKEIGGEICKAAVYGKGPGVGDFFDQIQKPESPPQFFAVVDEIPMTDITPTPRSMYNVYYHMYAGENEDIRYSVYLKQEDPFTGQGGIIYVFGEGRQISNVILGAGESEDISADFEASSGYDQVCVRIASTTYGIREECGFGKATSSFAIDRLSDIYTANQATKFIETEEQCTPSVGRVTELSQQGGSVGGVKAAVGTFSTGLTQTGIIRRCSYYNPGVGDDENKWAPVGSCGKDDRGRELGRCWLYQENIQNLIRHKEVEEAVKKGLKSAEDNLREKGIIEKGVTVAGGINVIAEVEKALPDTVDSVSFRSLISQLEKVISEVYDAKGDEDLVVKARAQFTIGLVYKKWGEVLREGENGKKITTENSDASSGEQVGAVQPKAQEQIKVEKKEECKLEDVYFAADQSGNYKYSDFFQITKRLKIYLIIKGTQNACVWDENSLDVRVSLTALGQDTSWSSSPPGPREIKINNNVYTELIDIPTQSVYPFIVTIKGRGEYVSLGTTFSQTIKRQDES